jgi:hypothetical protein
MVCQNSWLLAEKDQLQNGDPVSEHFIRHPSSLFYSYVPFLLHMGEGIDTTGCCLMP